MQSKIQGVGRPVGPAQLDTANALVGVRETGRCDYSNYRANLRRGQLVEIWQTSLADVVNHSDLPTRHLATLKASLLTRCLRLSESTPAGVEGRRSTGPAAGAMFP